MVCNWNILIHYFLAKAWCLFSLFVLTKTGILSRSRWVQEGKDACGVFQFGQNHGVTARRYRFNSYPRFMAILKILFFLDQIALTSSSISFLPPYYTHHVLAPVGAGIVEVVRPTSSIWDSEVQTEGFSPFLFTRLTSIVFICPGVLLYNAWYIQLIGLGISIYSGGLFTQRYLPCLSGLVGHIYYKHFFILNTIANRFIELNKDE